MRGSATKAISDIVEERQRSRYAPFAAARPCGLRPPGQQQNVNLFLREPLEGSMRCALRWFILLAAVSALLVGPALGQGVFGGILGTVTDPSGAAVPNADITITDTDRGITYQTRS